MTPIEALHQYFGFTAFRGSQASIIDRVRGGDHALVIMPTGAGKSLCYQIPALLPCDDELSDRPRITLVLSPLIALMKDQVDALRARGIEATFINSSLSRDERQKRYAEVAEGRYRLLYVTPERFRKSEFLEVIARRHVRLLAVDEAHCISEWGHDFRPDYSRLIEIRELLGQPTTIALTATATPDVQADIVRQLGLEPEQIELFHEGIERPNLRLGVQEVWGDDEKLEQIVAMRERYAASTGSGIVYFTLIRTLERFSELLRQRRVSHVCYHGDLERNDRRRIQNEFMQGECPLVLATPAFGMGIDKEDIRFVLHAEIPGSMEAWYQEIGRAGVMGSLPIVCCCTTKRTSRLKWNSSAGATPTPIFITAFMTWWLTITSGATPSVSTGCASSFMPNRDTTTAWKLCWECSSATASSRERGTMSRCNSTFCRSCPTNCSTGTDSRSSCVAIRKNYSH